LVDLRTDDELKDKVNTSDCKSALRLLVKL